MLITCVGELLRCALGRHPCAIVCIALPARSPGARPASSELVRINMSDIVLLVRFACSRMRRDKVPMPLQINPRHLSSAYEATGASEPWSALTSPWIECDGVNARSAAPCPTNVFSPPATRTRARARVSVSCLRGSVQHLAVCHCPLVVRDAVRRARYHQ